MQVKHVILHDPADRIALIMRPTDVMAFLANEDMIAGRVHAAGFFRKENVCEAPSG